jgi:hypothetical protein
MDQHMKHTSFFVSALLLPVVLVWGTATRPEASGLRGNVTEAGMRMPVDGVRIYALQMQKPVDSTRTDAKGAYSLRLPAGEYEVVFRHTGKVTQRIVEVTTGGDKQTVLNITLENAVELEETVVVPYGMLQRLSALDTKEGVLSDAFAKKTKPTAKILSTGGERTPGREGKAAYKMKSAPMPTAPATGAAPADVSATYAPSEAAVLDEVRIASTATPKAINKATLPVDHPAAKEREVVVKDAGLPTPTTGSPSPRAGLLTAGEWNDLHNWNRHWTDMLADGETDAFQKTYACFPRHRYTLLLTNAQDVPLADVPVQLLSSGGDLLWEARTDNTGKAELWAGFFEKESRDTARLQAVCTVEGRKHNLSALKTAKNGLNRLKIAASCRPLKNVDIVWAVDATGSMGDELEYLKTELLDVMGRTRSALPDLSFRMGTVFYRDVTDEYLVKSSGLSYNLNQTVEFIRRQSADGGGDFPEAVHTALEEVIFNQRWSESAVARICFLVLDASPHQTPAVNASLQRCLREAARRGIRIVPVASSGIQKDTEFLMKFFGLATNGTYVFLTDHSGIGGKHLTPTTDEYKVESLNRLLIRLITEYSSTENCEGQSAIRFEDVQQGGNSWQALYYPNPASALFTLELPTDVETVTLYDSEGKAVKKMEHLSAGQHRVDLASLPDGFYTIRILKEGQWQSGKLLVVRS